MAGESDQVGPGFCVSYANACAELIRGRREISVPPSCPPACQVTACTSVLETYASHRPSSSHRHSVPRRNSGFARGLSRCSDGMFAYHPGRLFVSSSRAAPFGNTTRSRGTGCGQSERLPSLHVLNAIEDAALKALETPPGSFKVAPNGSKSATSTASDVVDREGLNPHYQTETQLSPETKELLNDYLLRILRSHVYEVAIESPLEIAHFLSSRYDNKVYFKREDLQSVFSFKLRGAYNKMASLTPQQRAAGIVACSAGNHAQGVALAARTLGCEATIVMPKTTPEIKVNAVRRLGGKVVLHGESYDGAAALAAQLEKDDGMVFVHPFDDPHTIAGQGTCGMEIIRQTPDNVPHAIFVPVGGGGLLAGIAAYVKKVAPSIKVIGVEPVDSNCMYQSLMKGERVTLDTVGLFADGVAVRLCGKHNFDICKHLVDEIVLVTTDELCAAIKDVFTDTRSILEPAGALSVAGLKKYVEETGIKGETLVAVTSGANMNFDTLRYVSERSELGEQREAVMAVTIPERPGGFRRFCSLLGPVNITEFNYRFSSSEKASVFVGVQVKNRKEREQILQLLRDDNIEAMDMTENEMAKLHVRHMVGGRADLSVSASQSSGLEHDEVVYRFEFPERPGALMKFLSHLPLEWNISLFHYRNHGADVGRVLVAFQVPPEQGSSVPGILDSLGYTYVCENENPAYSFFLR